MTSKRNRVGIAQRADRTDWTADGNAAVRELLDFVARELAEEYVRLMRDTGESLSASETNESEENR